MNKSNCFVSVVLVIENVKKTIGKTLHELGGFLDENFNDYEILLVDQCSTDGTEEELRLLLKQIQAVRCIRLVSSVETDIAFAAGMENAIGDFVVLYSAGEDPLGCILQAVVKCQQGSDIVVGVARQSQTLGYMIVRPWIQLLLKKIGYDLPRNTTSFRCLTRRAVNSVTQTGRFHHQFYVRISKTGCASDVLQYQARNRKKRTFTDGLKQTLNLLVFNSTVPLRWMSVMGAVGSSISLFFAAYSILIRLFKDDVIEGWTSLAFVMSFLFMLMFTILAFFGEYLGRLLDDRSEHRDYSIAGELNSSVMLDVERLNVIYE